MPSESSKNLKLVSSSTALPGSCISLCCCASSAVGMSRAWESPPTLLSPGLVLLNTRKIEAMLLQIDRAMLDLTVCCREGIKTGNK